MSVCLFRYRLQQAKPAFRLLLALLIVVIFYSSTSAASTAASSGNPILTPVPLAVLDTSVIQGRPLRIVLAGPSGVGKTLFCEFLRFALRTSGMADPAQASAEFLRGYHLLQGTEESFLSDTQKVTKYTETLNGGGSVEIYDTPGLLDTAGAARDFEHLVEIDKQLESLDYVDAVLFVFHGGQQSRLDDRMKEVLAQLSAVFQPGVYPNIALLFSHLSRPRKSRQMMIDSYLKAEFGFTSEEVKSRRFFVNNPLDAMAALFDPNAEVETIASVLQRGESLHRTRYNEGVQELSRLLRYFASSKSCANPNFGTFSLKKGFFEYLAREDALHTNGAVPTLDLKLASDKSSLDATLSSGSRTVLQNTLHVTSKIQQSLRLGSAGSVALLASKFFHGFHFGVTLCMVACDLIDQDTMMLQATMDEFQKINEKLDSLVDRIQDVVHEEMKKARFTEIKARSSAILKLADQLATACHQGEESGSIFDDLVLTCSNFEPCVSQAIIRAYHIPDSEQDSILSRANYDPRRVEDVYRALALMLANLLRAADIARTVRGLSTAGADWRSQLRKRLFRQAYRTSSHDQLIAEAKSILNDFQAGILPKLRQCALSCALPENMRSVLENHIELSTNVASLHQVLMDWYRPLYREDELEFFVAVYNEAKNDWFSSAPPLHQQFLFTNPDKTLNGRPCAVKVERVNGKCALVMWNTCKPKLTADTFRKRFKHTPGEVDPEDAVGILPTVEFNLRDSGSKLAGEEYCSFQLVHSGYGWRGRSTCPERFVCGSPILLSDPHKMFEFFGPVVGDDEFDLVIG